MRIIAGDMRGRTLYAPQGMDTRPTQDKVRESIFNILRYDVLDARVLDLFAGSGALALEALSRGAKSAVAVDTSRQAVACIHRNVDNARVQDRMQVLAMDYRRAAQKLAAQGAQFDLVFIDPPYRMESTGEIAALLWNEGLLAPECVLVIEHRAGAAPKLSAPLEMRDVRTYGITQVTFAGIAAQGREEADE